MTKASNGRMAPRASSHLNRRYVALHAFAAGTANGPWHSSRTPGGSVRSRAPTSMMMLPSSMEVACALGAAAVPTRRASLPGFPAPAPHFRHPDEVARNQGRVRRDPRRRSSCRPQRRRGLQYAQPLKPLHLRSLTLCGLRQLRPGAVRVKGSRQSSRRAPSRRGRRD